MQTGTKAEDGRSSSSPARTARRELDNPLPFCERGRGNGLDEGLCIWQWTDDHLEKYNEWPIRNKS